MRLELVGRIQDLKREPMIEIALKAENPGAILDSMNEEVPLLDDLAAELVAKIAAGEEAEHGFPTWCRIADSRFAHKKDQWVDQGVVTGELTDDGQLHFLVQAAKNSRKGTEYTIGLLAGRFSEMLLTHYPTVIQSLLIRPINKG